MLDYYCCQVNWFTLCYKPLIEMITVQSLRHIIIQNRGTSLSLKQYPMVTNVHSCQRSETSGTVHEQINNHYSLYKVIISILLFKIHYAMQYNISKHINVKASAVAAILIDLMSMSPNDLTKDRLDGTVSPSLSVCLQVSLTFFFFFFCEFGK